MFSQLRDLATLATSVYQTSKAKASGRRGISGTYAALAIVFIVAIGGLLVYELVIVPGPSSTYP